MAYDPATEQLILFGGLTLNGVPTDRNDTWVWNGTDWEELTPPTKPSARSNASIAYDAAAERLILFGGYTTAEHPLGDTWAWNGTDWKNSTPPTNPSARSIAAMAYDAPREQVILFGGAGESPGALGETWAFGLPIPAVTPTTPTPPPADASTEPPAPAAHCVVPKLGGKKLKAAKKKIRAADCRTGKVKKTNGATSKTGKVKSQSPKPGKTLAAGAKINIQLSP